MQTPVRFLIGSAFALATAAIAHAHPGHDSSDLPELLKRPFGGLDHFAAALVVAALAGGCVALAARSISRSRAVVWSSAAAVALTIGAAAALIG